MRVMALSGGGGGARLVDGLARLLSPEDLAIVANTGDDFQHWGLQISPDVDTLMYTLAGLIHPEQGWGLAGETFHALEAVQRYGGEAWFRLGDRDLATHLMRTQALASGERLTDITARLCRQLGIRARVLPMADGPRRTMLDTVELGVLPFQDYFVKHRFQPTVRRVFFDGAPPPTPEVRAALEQADVVIIGPSNPYVSIDPILTLPGLREALARKPVYAVSPIVHGRALKGCAAKMMEELGAGPASAVAVARHYGGLLAGFIVERGERVDVPGLRVIETETVMATPAARERLAREVLAFAR